MLGLRMTRFQLQMQHAHPCLRRTTPATELPPAEGDTTPDVGRIAFAKLQSPLFQANKTIFYIPSRRTEVFLESFEGPV